MRGSCGGEQINRDYLRKPNLHYKTYEKLERKLIDYEKEEEETVVKTQ
jgi:hypothetical protein